MANSKISALTSATTPLAGTETLPIVQSSATTKVTVANLTAGRSVSAADYVMSTGNLVPSTAAKGVNLTANTPLAGMTSQLFNWYEEGTYTPTATNLTTITGTASWSGKYTRVGRLMTVYFILSGGNFTITQGSTTISLPKAATGYETGLIVNPNTNVGNYGFQVASGTSFGYVGTTATGTGFAGSVTYIV
jgi:hypothetical protein